MRQAREILDFDVAFARAPNCATIRNAPRLHQGIAHEGIKRAAAIPASGTIRGGPPRPEQRRMYPALRDRAVGQACAYIRLHERAEVAGKHT